HRGRREERAERIEGTRQGEAGTTLDAPAHLRADGSANIAPGADAPGDLRGGEEPHRSMERDHVPADLASDRDRSVEHDDVPASHAGDGRAPAEHDDLPDH